MICKNPLIIFQKKPERERWVCAEFVENLGITFNETEIVSPDDDPPDTIFRDARFEIKEILNPQRRRHSEYKAELKRVQIISNPQDLLKSFTPQDITPQQVSVLILNELKDISDHYAPSVRTNIDLLFYVNLKSHFLKTGPMPVNQIFRPFGWRSVSAVIGWGALVFFAESHALSILHANIETLTQKKFV